MFLDIILYVIYYTHVEIFMFYFKKYENIKKNKKNEKKNIIITLNNLLI